MNYELLLLLLMLLLLLLLLWHLQIPHLALHVHHLSCEAAIGCFGHGGVEAAGHLSPAALPVLYLEHQENRDFGGEGERARRGGWVGEVAGREE